MGSKLITLLKWATVLILAVAVTFLGVRAYDAQQGAPLEPWHTFVPHELSADELDQADWAKYLEVEKTIFEEIRVNVTQRLAPEERIPANRYFQDSPVNPEGFVQDWNRSYTLEPTGTPVGVVVLLHGLTDSPYSLRHIARRYQERGFATVAPRLPGHGSVPAGLAQVQWEDWTAATRLAVREARRRVGPGVPLHIVGFSNGGALAMKYALDAIDDPKLPRADRIILISPMIGITAMARFAGFAGLPALLPRFAKAAWLSIMPEFNPFKYNSFPINGARQSSLLTRALQPRLARAAQEGRLSTLPPILTFQSITDFTVSTPAVVNALYAHLPENGSELVLFDLNRHTEFGPLLRPSTETMLARLLPKAPRRYRTSVVTNASAGSAEVVERVTQAGATTEQVRPLGLTYPGDVFSLSHVALPFPVTDSLYGMTPDLSENFGVHLGSIAVRGERGVLIVSLDSLIRMSSNPFFPYLLDRVTEQIDTPVGGGQPAPGH
ncbi:alpha/beta hydrolase [uncultured Thiodictyon sp.]|uniref:alpha/beta hydrolase n=1 Tax=uncultured Thiodictyon sp. TaxID=1846217 RepID=UPI0025E2021A|nr:alpha/beta hydrolase [uncultured Thiodictyon sp.]